MSVKKLKISDDKFLDVAEIPRPNVYGGEIVRLKHEFIYADFDLTVQEQRLLFYFMSKFGTEDFFRSPQALNAMCADGTWNYSKLTQKLTDEVFWCTEHRTLILSAYETAKIVQASKMKGYEVLENAVKTMQSKMLTIRGECRDGVIRRRTITPIECSMFYEDDGKQKVVISFTQSFMPYVLALSNYEKLEIKTLKKFKSKYAARFYHWFQHQLANPTAKNEISITITELRSRFGIPDGALERHFFKRVIEGPINELIAETEMKVSIEKILDRNKRGQPLKKVTFKIKKK